MARSAAVLVAFLVAGPVAHAQQVRQWTGGDGDFDNSNNWNPTSVPGENNTARFNQDATYTVTFDISPNNRALEQTVGTVTFVSDGQQFYILTGSNQTPSLLSGGLLTLGGSGNPLDVNFQGHLHVNGGQLNVFHGSQVEVNSLSKFGSEGTTGVINVTGSGSTFDVTGSSNDVRIGNEGGTGTLIVTGSNSPRSTLRSSTITIAPLGNGAVKVKEGAVILGGTTHFVPVVEVGRSGTGTLNIESGGRVNSDIATIASGYASMGTATVTGSDSAWTISDDLYIGGGTLTVTLIDGFMPSLNDIFNLFNAGIVYGEFASISLPFLALGESWDTTQLYSDGIITVIPEPGAFALLAFAGLFVILSAIRQRKRQLSHRTTQL